MVRSDISVKILTDLGKRKVTPKKRVLVDEDPIRLFAAASAIFELRRMGGLHKIALESRAGSKRFHNHASNPRYVRRLASQLAIVCVSRE
jgi:hypothetical protein